VEAHSLINSLIEDNMNTLKKQAQELASYGRNGDTMLAHITPEEAALLKSMGGSGTINPDTGLPEFFLDSIISAGASLLGGMLGGDSASDAAASQANAQLQAARIAAEESRFRPVAITTGFGRSAFETGDDGRVSGASYTLTPELQALRDQLVQQALSRGTGLAERGLGAAEGLFDLGQQFVAQTPQQAAQQWMASQQAALAPAREQAMSGLMNRLAQTGTQGLGVAQAGGGMANPLAQAFANAQAQQDLQLAAQAQEQGRAQTQFGTGLFADALRLASGGYSPLSTQLQQAQGIEGLGQQALELGSALGGRIANPGGASALMQGGMAAANTLGAVQGYNPLATSLMGLGQNQQFTQGLGNWLRSSAVGPGGMPTGSMGGISPYGGNASRGFLTGGF
jgi:hypothetical protein